VAEQTVQLVENARGLFVMLGEEMIRGFRRDEFEGGEEEEEETTSEVETTEHERESRKVRKDGMVVFRNQSFGPLGDNFIGQTVEVELNGDHLDVFPEDELLDSFLYQE
jgi:hypothetical protein